jgi:hypothetical protein
MPSKLADFFSPDGLVLQLEFLLVRQFEQYENQTVPIMNQRNVHLYENLIILATIKIYK